MACSPYRSADHLRKGGTLHAARHLYDRFRYWLRGIVRGVFNRG